MNEEYLTKVERSLCCPDGCRAIACGDLAACGASKTRDHARAAIKIIEAQHDVRIAALADIRKLAAKYAMLCEARGDLIETDRYREICARASDVL